MKKSAFIAEDFARVHLAEIAAILEEIGHRHELVSISTRLT
ncbi:hypothetical protein CES85_3793 (plasmid) [Ochrobactrum quorumnocens]|uniref:Uncharacterized protein n=1 Tax=Ochrobactrum quorumnocens TaxID=271865 RepID=A0A248UM58_9HYPH|nr:hypothetical protein CES85_3793 [[Ochrobactrum] quorumnocens]